MVATPALDDPNFDRAVVYVLEHHTEGALGVIVNQPTGVALQEPLDRWDDLLAHPGGAYHGGPVEPDAMIGLVRAVNEVTETTDAMSPVSGVIASADLSTDPALIAGGLSHVRVFRGYSGWGSGQLEREIDEGAWLVLDAVPEDVFSTAPSDLWRTVMARQPGRLSWLALAPDDLSLN